MFSERLAELWTTDDQRGLSIPLLSAGLHKSMVLFHLIDNGSLHEAFL